MELKIGNKEYKMKFGISFLNELDKFYPIQLENGQVTIPFYDGLNWVHMGLQQASPVAIFNMIKSATSTEKTKPSNEDIEAFLDESDLIELATDFFMQLRQTNILKLKMKVLDEQHRMKIEE